MRELFLQRLHANVRMMLASTPDARILEELAQLVDKIMEVATPAVATVNTAPDVKQLKQEVAEVKTLLLTITQPRRRLHGHSLSSDSQRQTHDICWYHAKFGDNARKCTLSCAKSLGNSKASS